jgi:hypothetical protein
MRPLLFAALLLAPTPRWNAATPAQYSPALTCYQRASTETLLSDDDAFILCGGAASNGPIDCYERAQDELTLGDPESMALCRCAESTEPVDCVNEARDETTLDTSRILAICSARVVLRLYDDCSPQL